VLFSPAPSPRPKLAHNWLTRHIVHLAAGETLPEPAAGSHEQLPQRRIQVMVATDIAAPRIDVTQVSHVINYMFRIPLMHLPTGSVARPDGTAGTPSPWPPRRRQMIRSIEQMMPSVEHFTADGRKLRQRDDAKTFRQRFERMDFTGSPANPNVYFDINPAADRIGCCFVMPLRREKGITGKYKRL